jgi:hypothetical protein
MLSPLAFLGLGERMFFLLLFRFPLIPFVMLILGILDFILTLFCVILILIQDNLRRLYGRIPGMVGFSPQPSTSEDSSSEEVDGSGTGTHSRIPLFLFRFLAVPLLVLFLVALDFTFTVLCLILTILYDHFQQLYDSANEVVGYSRDRSRGWDIFFEEDDESDENDEEGDDNTLTEGDDSTEGEDNDEGD